MRARLTDGSVVELAQDCDCVIHEGPHWLHSDKITQYLLEKDYRQPVEQIIAKGAAATLDDVRRAELLFQHYAERQAMRLQELSRHMKRCGIVEILD